MAKKKNYTMDAAESYIYDVSRNTSALMMDYNAQEAAKARNWSEYMSNTSHQREVADLKAAGLNPALSLNGGAASYTANSASSAADSPTGALAQLAQVKMNNKVNLQMSRMALQGQLASAAATKAAAAASAAGMVGAASINAAASNYAADKSYASAQYTADHTKTGAVLGAGKSIKDKGISGVLNDWAEFWSK